MTHLERTLVGLFGGLMLGVGAAQTIEPAHGTNPYQEIVERNAFGLRPPPPPPDPESLKPPPPRIFLTGITTIAGHKRVLLKATPPAKPGAPAKEKCYVLGENQRDGELEVVQIDERAGTAKVTWAGVAISINFLDNGIKTSSASAPGNVPRMPNAFPPSPAGFNPSLRQPVRFPSRPFRPPTGAMGARKSPGEGPPIPTNVGGTVAYGKAAHHGVSLGETTEAS